MDDCDRQSTKLPWYAKVIWDAFQSYYENANVEYFEKKYGTDDREKIEKKLVNTAVLYSALLGLITGIALSADLIFAFLTVVSGVGPLLSVFIYLGGILISSSALAKIQFQLVCNLAKLHDDPFEKDDPEDQGNLAFLTVVLIFIEATSLRVNTKVTSKICQIIEKELTGDRLKLAKQAFKMVGLQFIKKSFLKYLFPVLSVLIAVVFNILSTRAVAGYAKKYFQSCRTKENSDCVSV